MRQIIVALAALACTVPAADALAQPTSPTLPPQTWLSRRLTPPEAIHRHSSTAYEGARRGEAAWITAFGEYLVDESQAAYVWEHVESMHYDNVLKKTATALTRKQVLAAYREHERQVRRDRQEAAKQLWEARYLELAHRYRLDEYQFNFATGAIYWPALAASPRYAQYRQNISLLMDNVVHYGVAEDPVLRDRIATACDRFRYQLRKDAADDSPLAQDEYKAMQRFLVGLKYTPYLMLEASSATQHLTMK